MRRKRRHTSVIYFHGIGAPDRESSLAQLLDYFDLFGQEQKKAEVGKPRGFDYKYEEVLGEEDPIGYVEFKRILENKGTPFVDREVRFYEAYWTPEQDSVFTLRFLLSWMLSRASRPFDVARSNWRSFASLKINSLHRLIGESDHSLAQRLERLFRDFENWGNRSKYPKGSASEFLDFVRSSSVQEPEKVIKLALRWIRSFYQQALLSCLAAIFGIFVFLTTCFAVLKLVIYCWFRINSDEVWSTSEILVWTIAAPTILIFIWQARSIFRTHLADVLTWTISSEREVGFNAKLRVLSYAQKLFRQVAGNEGCDRCIIIGHSLGSSIALEALMREGRNAKMTGTGNTGWLGKISHIFTIGSPIELIFDFFQADRSHSHRHSRLEEAKRLSLSLPPFLVDDKPTSVRIVNVWSKLDPLSYELFSPRRSISEPWDTIVNLEVLSANAPFNCHTSYFKDRNVMRSIFWTVMTGRLPSATSNPKVLLPSRVSIFIFLLSFISTLLSIFIFILISESAFLLVPFFSVLFITGISVFVTVANASREYVRESGEFLKR